jgi:hypothetical protein
VLDLSATPPEILQFLPGIPDVSLAVVVDEAVARRPPIARAVLDALAVPPPGGGFPMQVIAMLTGEALDLCRRAADATVQASLVVTGPSGAYALLRWRTCGPVTSPGSSTATARWSRAFAERPALVWAIATGD